MKKILCPSLLIIITNAFSMQSPQAPSGQQWDGKYFHKHTKKSFPLAKQVLARHSLEHCKCILDVGCGSGDITAHIAGKAPQAKVLGIDPSESMIRFAKGYYENQKNLSFGVAAVSENDDTFDFIFSCNAFHLIPKTQQKTVLYHLETAARKHRPSSLLMIMAAKTEAPQPFVRAYIATIHMDAWKKLQAINLDDYFQPHNEKSFTPLIENTHFKVKYMEIIDEHIIFKSTKKLAKFVTSWMGGFGFVAALPKEEQKQLITDLINNYTKEVQPVADGSIEWRSPRFVVHAEKK
jgi:trans-aconitate methyltransferase